MSRLEVVPAALLRAAEAVGVFAQACREPLGPSAALPLGAPGLDAALLELTSAQERSAEALAEAAQRTAGSLRASAALYRDVEALLVPRSLW